MPLPPTGRHRPSVRIGQRYLFIRGGAQDRRKVLQRGRPLAQRRDLVLQSRLLGSRDIPFLAVSRL
jgi:hypothetical protein